MSHNGRVSIAAGKRVMAEPFCCDIPRIGGGSDAGDPKADFFRQLFSLGDLSPVDIITPVEEGPSHDLFQEYKRRVHHISFQTSDIRRAMTRLKGQGIPFFGYDEYPGGGWKEIFIHPRHACGTLVQIVEIRTAKPR